VEESNSAPAIAGATSQGSAAALNTGSRFLAIPGNPGKPLFCARFSTQTRTHAYTHEHTRARAHTRVHSLAAACLIKSVVELHVDYLQWQLFVIAIVGQCKR
jgi:hypothetical protein